MSAWLARGDESSVDDCCSRTAVRHHRATSEPCAQMSRHERLVYNSTVSVVLMCACRSDRHLDVCTHTSDRMIRRAAGITFFQFPRFTRTRFRPISDPGRAGRTGGSRFVAEPSWPSPSMDMAMAHMHTTHKRSVQACRSMVIAQHRPSSSSTWHLEKQANKAPVQERRITPSTQSLAPRCVRSNPHKRRRAWRERDDALLRPAIDELRAGQRGHCAVSRGLWRSLVDGEAT